MDKNVIISLKGIQNGDGNDPIELVTVGKYHYKDNKHFITYEESEMTGMKGTTTTLTVEGDKVTLMRTGSNNTQLIFEKGQRHVNCYETPYGSLSVGVRANNVQVSLGEEGGEISAKYELEVNNSVAGFNDFYMKFTPATLVTENFDIRTN